MIDRRRFLALTGTVAAAALVPAREGQAQEPPSIPGAAIDLEEMTISEMADGMRAGRLTARGITETYLRRINAIDRNGPALNSIIELNPEALAIADSLDRERRERGPRGPLHGVPILIKDNIDTADGMKTTAGSLAMMENVAARDAHIVKRLREAGAILLGKTNLSEWANFRSTHSTSGWSARGGLTRNPYVLDRNCCGSSTGSASAIAANLAAAAVGTETDGSIVCPSSGSSLVGIKPTIGLVSRSGIIPISESQDTAGPMARNVTDAAILLGVLAGIDSLDAATAASRGKGATDYTKTLDKNGLQGARIGVARKYFGFNDHVDRLMTDALDAMKTAGATIIDPVDLARGQYDESEFEVLLYEFKDGINRYLKSAPPAVTSRSLADLIRFNEENKDKEMPYFGQEIFEMAQKKGPLTDSAYKKALAKNHRLSRTEGIDAIIRKHKLDAIVAPTGSPMWPTDLLNGDHYTGGYSSASAVSGYPHITVPAGRVFGLPVGISFFAGAWSEPTLLRLAYAFESATSARRPPTFLQTARM